MRFSQVVYSIIKYTWLLYAAYSVGTEHQYEGRNNSKECKGKFFHASYLSLLSRNGNIMSVNLKYLGYKYSF